MLLASEIVYKNKPYLIKLMVANWWIWQLKSTQQNHAVPKSGEAKAHVSPVATGLSKPSVTNLDHDLAQGYIVIVFVYVLIGVLILTFYILRQRSSKRKK